MLEMIELNLTAARRMEKSTARQRRGLDFPKMTEKQRRILHGKN